MKKKSYRLGNAFLMPEFEPMPYLPNYLQAITLPTSIYYERYFSI